MAKPKLSKLELKVMEVLWDHGEISIREIQETFPHRTQALGVPYDDPDYGVSAGGKSRPSGVVRKVGNFSLVLTAVEQRSAASAEVD